MSNEWLPGRITEYRAIVDTLRQDTAKMAAGTLRAFRQEGDGPLLDVTVEMIVLNEAQIKALEVLISIELERGMEPVPHQRVDREDAVKHFMSLAGNNERLREGMVAAVDSAIRLLAVDERRNDELWTCQSRYVGPLAGHEGLGVVRRGKILRYEVFIRY